MKRTIILGAILLVVTLVGLAVVALLSLNRLVHANRDRIAREAERALGRSVALGDIGVSLGHGLALRIDDVRVADDPRFGDADFIRLGGAVARARLLPLLSGNLEIASILVESPVVTLVRDSSGWNFATLKILQQKTGASDSSGSQAVEGRGLAALPFLFGRAVIADGTIAIVDRRGTSVHTTRLSKLALEVRDVSVDTPLDVSFSAALDADTPNIRLDGSVGLLTAPAFVPIEVRGSLGPLGPRGLRANDVHLRGGLHPDRFEIDELTGSAFDGHFACTGSYPTAASGTMLLRAKTSDVAVAQLLPVVMDSPPLRFEGIGQLSLDLRATTGSADMVAQTLGGQVVADVADGVLRDLNVVNEVLGRVTGVRGIGALLSAQVKPKYASLFREPDTRFERLHATFEIADERIRTSDLTITATDYAVRVEGSVGFDRRADLRGTLSMSKPFSESLAADVKEIRSVLDASGQLSVPFRLRGRLGEAKPTIDPDYLANTLRNAALGRGAQSLVDALLGSKAPGSSAEKSGESSSPFERRLRDLLGR